MRIFCIVTPRGNAWRIIYRDSHGVVSSPIRAKLAHRILRNLGV